MLNRQMQSDEGRQDQKTKSCPRIKIGEAKKQKPKRADRNVKGCQWRQVKAD